MPAAAPSKPVSAQEIAAEVKQELSVLLSTICQELNQSIEIAADRISQHVKTTTFDLKRDIGTKIEGELATFVNLLVEDYIVVASDPAAYQKVYSAAKHPPSLPHSDSEPGQQEDADFSGPYVFSSEEDILALHTFSSVAVLSPGAPAQVLNLSEARMGDAWQHCRPLVSCWV